MLDDLNKRFVYTSDKKQFGVSDRWHLMRNETGPLYGDCEDYSYTLLWMLEGKSFKNMFWALLTRKAELWYCYSPSGITHTVLKYKGKWVDNIQKEFVDDLESLNYKMIVRWWIPAIVFKVFIKR